MCAYTSPIIIACNDTVFLSDIHAVNTAGVTGKNEASKPDNYVVE